MNKVIIIATVFTAICSFAQDYEYVTPRNTRTRTQTRQQYRNTNNRTTTNNGRTVTSTTTEWIDPCMGVTNRSVRVTRTYSDGTTSTKELPVVTFKLPEKVLNPANYGNTNASLSYVSTSDLIAQGQQILKQCPNYIDYNGSTIYRVGTSSKNNNGFGNRW